MAKKPKARAKREPNPNNVFIHLDDETAHALVAYVRAQKVRPERTAVCVAALRVFLITEGFLKPDLT